MSGIKPLLDCITITLKNRTNGAELPIYLDVFDNSLSVKWLEALNQLLIDNYHLEKNYCFLGFANSNRSAEYLINQINNSIACINSADLGYIINDHFSIENTVYPGTNYHEDTTDGYIIHDKLNWLHRYFEDLQGQSGQMSQYYNCADSRTRWHIRQLNLLCHEYESLILSMRKVYTAPEWMRPSQLMCWLNAPRFNLETKDYDLFGIETINRPLGGVYVGVNKAVGKHHWEVFNDEGRDSRINELITTTLSSQTEAAGDFDIEWGVSPANRPWQVQRLNEFRTWLVDNGIDPDDKTLTIGHPRVGQVDLIRSFGTDDYASIWSILDNYLDVYKISTSCCQAVYNYQWGDADYAEQQIKIIEGN